MTTFIRGQSLSTIKLARLVEVQNRTAMNFLGLNDIFP